MKITRLPLPGMALQLLSMVEKWKEYLDKQGFGGAILMDFLL